MLILLSRGRICADFVKPADESQGCCLFSQAFCRVQNILVCHKVSIFYCWLHGFDGISYNLHVKVSGSRVWVLSAGTV